jgi:glycerol uptake facilitator-like aquaporin
MTSTLGRRLTAEAVGTGFLVAAVIGSGVAAHRLSPNDPGLQLLENAIATGVVLTALILALGHVSAAFNPVVSIVDHVSGADREASTRQLVAVIAAQVAGGGAGAVVANLMFELPPVALASTTRTGTGVWLGEVVATGGLVLVIAGTSRTGRRETVALAVGGYIAGAYWFTSSTSFANPAVTLARTLSDTFAGVSPASVPGFLLAQAAGGALGYLLAGALFPRPVTHPVAASTPASATRQEIS